MTAMSAGIAILGLLLSSPAVVIGAMLLSPLMNPIIGTGFSLATGDADWLRRCGKALLAGSAFAILFCALIVFVSPLQTVTEEIAARTRPNLFDLLVALFSALAGSYAVIRGREGTIVGVAIATALMPPLAVVGFGLATFNWTVFGGALGLFITNLVTIGLTAAIMARLYGFQSDLTHRQSRFQSLGIIAIFLALAVPLGLMIAIYLAEYSGSRLRSFAKPAIEILAGIPTIVYGLFALITVGPLLRDWIAEPLGLGNSSSSVITAGLVMGIMLIPFVSSLSDDIINAVPQSMRDGSYGLGATQSETIKRVIMPAALPGIVGAVLLAASRAIGETMIVVMGAGASARLGLNPFDAMTTVTVKIVSQLTGDTEFASPETLVAFALGLTLFVFTLGLNILALYIVRKYREQYE